MAIFLQLDGIDGDSTDAAHVKWISVRWMSHGVERARMGGPAELGWGPGGVAQLQDVAIGKSVDKASPEILARCWGGKNIARATVEVTKAVDGKVETYIKIQMEDVYVSSVSPCSNMEAVRQGKPGQDQSLDEAITLRPARICYTFIPFGPKGKEAEIKKGWDYTKNEPWTK